MATFRGHVGPVYQVAWSSDSRLFVSGSKDSTLKVCVWGVFLSGGVSLWGPKEERGLRRCRPPKRCPKGVRMQKGRQTRGRAPQRHRPRAPQTAKPPNRRHPRRPQKVWDVRTRKLAVDLPGHADEVFTVDWSPDGASVASGGKDRVLKLWRH